MAITALDIKDKQFTTKFRGYNEQEVDEFLDILPLALESMPEENKQNSSDIRKTIIKKDNSLRETITQ